MLTKTKSVSHVVDFNLIVPSVSDNFKLHLTTQNNVQPLIGRFHTYDPFLSSCFVVNNRFTWVTQVFKTFFSRGFRFRFHFQMPRYFIWKISPPESSYFGNSFVIVFYFIELKLKVRWWQIENSKLPHPRKIAYRRMAKTWQWNFFLIFLLCTEM